jgi:tRNA(fMet)-specific endonuclease VapC
VTLPQVLINTDILSLLMRRNPAVVANAGLYLAEHKRFSISVITRYEILRGLTVKGAGKQATVFEDFCAQNEVVPISDDVVLRAAAIYADLYKRGELIGDADISDCCLSPGSRVRPRHKQRSSLPPHRRASDYELV